MTISVDLFLHPATYNGLEFSNTRNTLKGSGSLVFLARVNSCMCNRVAKRDHHNLFLWLVEDATINKA